MANNILKTAGIVIGSAALGAALFAGGAAFSRYYMLKNGYVKPVEQVLTTETQTDKGERVPKLYTKSNENIDTTIERIIPLGDSALALDAKIGPASFDLFHQHATSDRLIIKFENADKEISFEDKVLPYGTPDATRSYDGRVDTLTIRDGKVEETFYPDDARKKSEFELADRILAYVLHRYKKQLFGNDIPEELKSPAADVNFNEIASKFKVEYSASLPSWINKYRLDSKENFVLVEGITELGNIMFRHWGNPKFPFNCTEDLELRPDSKSVRYTDKGIDGKVDEIYMYLGDESVTRIRDGSNMFIQGDKYLLSTREKLKDYLLK